MPDPKLCHTVVVGPRMKDFLARIFHLMKEQILLGMMDYRHLWERPIAERNAVEVVVPLQTPTAIVAAVAVVVVVAVAEQPTVAKNYNNRVQLLHSFDGLDGCLPFLILSWF